MGKTRDLFKKITDTKGTFHAKMGLIKDRNGVGLTEAQDIKKTWEEYTELYKKDLHDPDNHDGVITHLPLASRVARGVSGPSSSCVWNPRVFADDARGWQCLFVLCLHPQGCLRRGVRASGPSQERTGESGAFGLWPHPRGSSRISS